MKEPEIALTPWKQVLKQEVLPTGTASFKSPILATPIFVSLISRCGFSSNRRGIVTEDASPCTWEAMDVWIESEKLKEVILCVRFVVAETGAKRVSDQVGFWLYIILW